MLFADSDPTYRCRRFVKFEGAMGYLGLAISSLIMSVRCDLQTLSDAVIQLNAITVSLQFTTGIVPF